MFHYTSADGLLGIVSKKELWATNTQFLNDSKEIEQAVDQTKLVIHNLLKYRSLQPDEVELLKKLNLSAGSASGRFYAASFSELRDSLSQWRAYCPSPGGYSLGIPSRQLEIMSGSQGFKLVKCIYDISLQCNIIREIVEQVLSDFNLKKEKNELDNNFIETLVRNFFLKYCQNWSYHETSFF